MPSVAQAPRLLDQVRDALRTRHYSRRTEKAYVGWIRRFVIFNGKRHPREMGEAEITRFLSHLAVKRQVSASTQNQALTALLFLYRDVLGIELEWLDEIVRAKRPQRLPVVLTRREVRVLLGRCGARRGSWRRCSTGPGLRLLECARLRVKDVDFERGEILVRDGKGRKDRVTMLPASLKEPLRVHLIQVRRQHEADLAPGSVRWSCRTRSRASTPTRRASGAGSGCSRRLGTT